MATKIKLSILNEQIVLGSMLTSKDLRKKYLKILTPRDFTAPRHQTIFAALAILDENKLDYIPSTLKGFIPVNDEDWGGIEYLRKLESLSAEENFEFHLDRVKWDKARVEVLGSHFEEFEKLLKDPNLDPTIATAYLKKIESTLSSARRQSFVISGVAASAMYQADLAGRQTHATARSTGYASLDKKLTSPAARGQVTAIAACSSIGKTTFSLNCAYRQAKQWRVGYLAWESGHNTAIDIICSSSLNIPLRKLVKESNKLSIEERNRLDEFLSTLFGPTSSLSFLKPPPTSICDKAKGPWETNDRVLDWVDSQIAEWGIEILYWDLFQKKLPDRRPDSISWALDRVQEMAIKHGTHFALLHQITLKEAELRENKRPTRTLLKGTGAWIETPDTVIGLHRQAVYENGLVDNELEVMCLKQRFGPWPWTIAMDWDGPCCRVTGGREITGMFGGREVDTDI
mgnify:CR=1 FL=1